MEPLRLFSRVCRKPSPSNSAAPTDTGGIYQDIQALEVGEVIRHRRTIAYIEQIEYRTGSVRIRSASLYLHQGNTGGTYRTSRSKRFDNSRQTYTAAPRQTL